MQIAIKAPFGQCYVTLQTPHSILFRFQCHNYVGSIHFRADVTLERRVVDTEKGTVGGWFFVANKSYIRRSSSMQVMPIVSVTKIIDWCVGQTPSIATAKNCVQLDYENLLKQNHGFSELLRSMELQMAAITLERDAVRILLENHKYKQIEPV